MMDEDNGLGGRKKWNELIENSELSGRRIWFGWTKTYYLSGPKIVDLGGQLDRA